MYFVTTIERILLESLNKSPKTLVELQDDLNFSTETIQNILLSLIPKGMVNQRLNKYHVNTLTCQAQLDMLNNKDNLQEEVIEIVSNSINSDFKLKKVALSSEDKAILKSLLFNLDKFLEEVSKKKNQCATKDLEVIFWGFDQYNNITQNILNK
jgi:GTPase involved in cell partitioning and DNA repair